MPAPPARSVRRGRFGPFGIVTGGLVAGAALAGGCWNEAADEWTCIGPLVEVVKWRDEREAARLYGGEAMAPAELARQERERVEAAVATLTPKRRLCELTWSVMMHQPADNPGLRLREETLLRVLELPPRDYPAEAVGWAGVTVAGRPPVVAGR